ncbi:MAG: META domain-containing protein [Acidimicrobiales bacterium]
MRRFASALVVLLLGLGGASCGDDTATPGPPGPPTTSGPTPMDESTTTTEAVIAKDATGDLLGRWLIQAYQDREGRFSDVTIRGAVPEITFGTDSSLVFHTGCNQGDTTYRTTGVYDGVNGQALTIAPGVTEDAYCDFGLGEQNIALPAAWLQATVFVLDGTTLELRTTDGTVVLSAERA